MKDQILDYLRLVNFATIEDIALFCHAEERDVFWMLQAMAMRKLVRSFGGKDWGTWYITEEGKRA